MTSRSTAALVACAAASTITAAGFAATGAQQRIEPAAKHLIAVPGLSAPTAAPGQRITLQLDLTPGPRVHVYAPGQQDYIPIRLRLAGSPEFTARPVRYPPPRTFYFEPLKQTVKIYDRPFRITQDVTLSQSTALREQAAKRERLAVTATLDYQACDDSVCYKPESVPLRWVIALTPGTPPRRPSR